MSSFMNIKDDNVEGIRNYRIRKMQAATRLKELEVPTAGEFIVHQTLNLNQLPSSFEQLKITLNDK